MRIGQRAAMAVGCVVLALCGGVAPATASPPASSGLAEQFARPDQTIEYHLMLRTPSMSEAALADSFAAWVAGPLKVVADVGPPGHCRLGRYVDSRARGLWAHHLVIRVRDGLLTAKVRSSSPVHLLDLAACSARKYEEDCFAALEYSISSDVRFAAGDWGDGESPGSVQQLWDLLARDCPGLWSQLRPLIAGTAGLEIPGAAHIYAAEATLHPAPAVTLVKAGVEVWFLPPTDRALAELSFTGYVKDRVVLDGLWREIRRELRAAHLLRADQSSKTEQYFAACFGASPGTHVAGVGGARPGQHGHAPKYPGSGGSAHPGR